MTDAERIAALREKARVLYEGRRVAHRSCGVAIAEAFGRDPSAYKVLRRGGITGEGRCGAMLAGELVLGELLGDPDPTGPVTPALREAIVWYRAELARRVDRGGAAATDCNALTARFPVFVSEERQAFCTELAAAVAEVLAETLARHGARVEPTPLPAR